MKYTPSNTAFIGKPARVFLDGKEVFDCVEADTKHSYVICYRRDDEGKLIIFHGELTRCRIEGHVTVTLDG